MTEHRWRAAVLGSPISHSRSPLLHKACYRVLGRDDCDYRAIEVRSGELAQFWSALDDSWMGLSLTMPLKEEVLPLLAGLDEFASAAKAVNTVVFTDDGPLGFNTDVVGFMEVLRPHVRDSDMSVVVVGAGATARSAVVALAYLGVNAVSVVARRADAVASLAACVPDVIVTHVPWPEPELAAPHIAADIIVSTAPASVGLPIQPRPGQQLLDVNYPDPVNLRTWVAAGGVGQDGRALLVHQGVAQALLFTGQVVDSQTLASLVSVAAAAVA